LLGKGILADPETWIGQPSLDGERVAAMIVKAAGQFAAVDNRLEAIAILQREGVINSPVYWKEHAVSGQRCDTSSVTRLIQKLAHRLRSP
ncbi:MAG: hypothetical protein ACK53L_21660, partial [Pirellulaceae bacterium]